MELEPERATTESTTPVVNGGGVDHAPFGIRPATGKPHSISLFGATPATGRGAVTRGVDILLGVGIGAVAMYYLDPDRGAARRAQVRDDVVRAARTFFGPLTARRPGALRPRVGSAEPALLARRESNPDPVAAARGP